MIRIASLVSALVLEAGASPPATHLQALTPTSGAGAEAVLDGDPSTGWEPTGDPGDEGLLLRFEAPLKADALRLVPCGSADLTLAISVDGNEVATTRATGSAKEIQLPRAGRGFRSVFVRIVATEGRACLAEVGLQRGGTPVPLLPPRAAAGAVSASSTLEPIDAYHPSYLFDGRLDYGWVEGAKGNGAGESVSIKLEQPVTVTAFEIWNGYQRSLDHYRKNARAKRVSLYADEKRVGTFQLKDRMGPQKLALPSPVTASVLQLKVEEAIAGARYPDLVISELRLFDASGPVSVRTADALEREAVLRAEIAHGPLAATVDRQLVAVCARSLDDEGERRFKLRTNHTFVWYQERSTGEEDQRREVFDGVWVPTRAGGPWAQLELYGRRHRIETSWQPYEEASAKETDRVAGGRVEIARVEDLGPAAFGALVAEWKAGAAARRVDCVAVASGGYEGLTKRGAVLVRGAAFTDLLAAPAR